MKCLYAGSFDPFTNGHLSIIREASNLFDSVYICISENSTKNRFIDKELMCKAMEKCLKANKLDNCIAITSNKLVADLCKDLDITYLVRGLRNTSDYLYEENIAKINKELNAELKTIYFRATDENISSSIVRELYHYGKEVDKYLPVEILELFK